MRAFVCAALLALCAAPWSTRAADSNNQTFTDVFTVPTCDGTMLSGVVRYHYLSHSTDSGNGGAHGFDSISAHGELTDTTSGTKYQFESVYHYATASNGGSQSDYTFQTSDRLQAQGQGQVKNLTYRSQMHVTTNANGDTTASVDHETVSCE